MEKRKPTGEERSKKSREEMALDTLKSSIVILPSDTDFRQDFFMEKTSKKRRNRGNSD